MLFEAYPGALREIQGRLFVAEWRLRIAYVALTILWIVEVISW